MLIILIQILPHEMLTVIQSYLKRNLVTQWRKQKKVSEMLSWRNNNTNNNEENILEIKCAKVALKEDSVVDCNVHYKTCENIRMQLLIQDNVTNEKKTALNYHNVSDNLLQYIDYYKDRIQAINIMKKNHETAK